jgi:hypothetical protein
MPSPKNYYKILQVDPTAEAEVITAAYKRLSLKYHPDTSQSSDAHSKMLEINEAYQVLGDPGRRSHYDLALVRTAESRGRTNQEAPGSSPREKPPANQARTQAGKAGQSIPEMIASLTFPVVYSLSVFILFRFFRPVNIVTIALVLILAGVIAYSARSRVERSFRKRS